jgi:hypothetical protein
MVNCPL